MNSLGMQPELVAQMGILGLRCHHLQARGEQLDRQGQAIEFPADCCHCVQVE